MNKLSVIPGKVNNPQRSISHCPDSHSLPFFKKTVQPKLTINTPGDMYEQEADSVADKVMRMTEHDRVQTKFFKPATVVQRKCTHCKEEEKKVQRKEADGETMTPTSTLENYLGNLSGAGHHLSGDTRNFYEPRFGYDFSNVKVHTDTAAAKSAQSINALAYTSGNNIVFNSQQYSPGTDSGKKLLAHELVHVMQQSGSSPGRVQAKVVDDDAHLPCRKTPGRDAATVTTLENTAAAMADTAVAALRQRPLSETVRKLLWTRFYLDYNDGQARCYTIPAIADRYEKVANSIRNTRATYRCTADATEPMEDCAGADAVTQLAALFGTGMEFGLCSLFWTMPNDIDRAAVLLHEWVHFEFGSRGALDEKAKGFDSTECYNAFANDLGAGSLHSTNNSYCPLNSNPLPPLNQTTIDHMPCPGNVILNVTGSVGYAGYEGKHYLTKDLGLDYLLPITTMHDWELTIGGRLKDFKPLEPKDEEAFSYGVRVGLQHRYRPWRFGWQESIYGEVGGVNINPAAGRDYKQLYVGGGVRAGLNIPLTKNTSLQLFGEIGAKAGFPSNDEQQFKAFEAGIGASLTIR